MPAPVAPRGDSILAALVLLACTAGVAAASPLFEAPYLCFETAPVPVSVAAGDLDGDGAIDLVTANVYSGTLSVLLGRGDGTFAPRADFESGLGPRGVTLADLNGDGNLDIAAVQLVDATVAVLLGRGDGSFEPARVFPTSTEPRALAAADLDRDGALDLVTLNSGRNNPPGSLSLFFGHGDGTFRPRLDVATGGSPASFRIGDANGDGVLDLVVANSDPDALRVLQGTGDGRFVAGYEEELPGTPYGLGIGDLNSDGRLDAAVYHENWDFGSPVQRIAIRMGDGSSGFVARPDAYPDATTLDIAVADVDSDGRADLVALSSLVSVLRGHGDGTFDLRRSFASGLAPQELVVRDVNRDGHPDVVVSASGSLAAAVLLGRGDGSYGTQPVHTEPQPQGLALQDVDGDGHLDLVLPSPVHDVVSVHRGRGDGTFGAQIVLPVAPQPASLAVADFDGDGAFDLATATFDSLRSVVSLLRGDGQGGFAAHVDRALGFPATWIVSGDWNRDGRADVAVSLWSQDWPGDGNVEVLLGEGNGRFTSAGRAATGPLPMGLAAGDANGDRRLDLAVTFRRRVDDERGGVTLLLGNGDGTFGERRDFTVGIEPRGLAWCDLNGDARADLVVANSVFFRPEPGSISVLLGRGDGSFDAQPELFTTSQPWSMVVRDFDRDGRPDLAVANAGANTVSLLLGRGDGGFRERFEFGAGEAPQWIASGDLDEDGRPDLVAANVRSSDVSVLFDRVVTTPVTVTGLQARSLPGGVRLSWQLAPEALAGLRGVHVERAPEPAGPYGLRTPVPLEPRAAMSFDDLFAGDAGGAPAAPDLWYRLQLLQSDGNIERSAAVAAQGSTLVSSLVLQPPRDPGGGSVEIRFGTGPGRGAAHLEIFAVDGRRLRVLDPGVLEPGMHLCSWDRRDAHGARTARGVYWVRLVSAGRVLQRRLLLLHD